MPPPDAFRYRGALPAPWIARDHGGGIDRYRDLIAWIAALSHAHRAALGRGLLVFVLRDGSDEPCRLALVLTRHFPSAKVQVPAAWAVRLAVAMVSVERPRP